MERVRSTILVIIIIFISLAVLFWPCVVSYFLLSSASYHLEQYEKGIDQDRNVLVRIVRDLEFARSLNPREVLIYLRLSQAYLYLQRPHDSINVLNAAIPIKPDSLLIKRELIRSALIANDTDLAIQRLREFSNNQVVSIIVDLIYHFPDTDIDALRSVLKTLAVDLDAGSSGVEFFISQLIHSNNWTESVLWLQALSAIYDENSRQFDRLMFRVVTLKLILGLPLASRDMEWLATSSDFIYHLEGYKLELSGENLRWLTEVRDWNVFAGELVSSNDRGNTMHWSGKAGFIVRLENTGCYQVSMKMRKIGDPFSTIYIYVNDRVFPFLINHSNVSFEKVFLVDLKREVNTIVVDYVLDNGDIVVEKIFIKKSHICGDF